ncbi:LysM peptidoglycan-binding domain-containing protein [Heliorestis acidaminivorans]|uniref:LysM peptidoglycan-binding domain-containing protein n=1 Tax=Heliorestis acidaminivorans TaxID=553427 RepID=A0A6I0F2D4_9FIRM|nr:LysM domain-containing protein [Heliorestis acidaminivorans]KAB2952508.1 LysM peptidoglycan-binding domain-containing protein [Heliorestis acidaminivorans]
MVAEASEASEVVSEEVKEEKESDADEAKGPSLNLIGSSKSQRTGRSRSREQANRPRAFGRPLAAPPTTSALEKEEASKEISMSNLVKGTSAERSSRNQRTIRRITAAVPKEEVVTQASTSSRKSSSASSNRSGSSQRSQRGQSKWKIVLVLPGDNLTKIARRNKVTEDAIRQLNQLDAEGTIETGQTLMVPRESLK